MLKRFAIFGSALAVFASPALAQMREAQLPEIFESYNDCFAVTESGSIDSDALESLGWSQAAMTDNEGNAIEGGPLIFGHRERAPIIILSDLEGKGICMVNARIESFDTFTQFTDAFGDNLPEPNENGAITYFAQGQVVQIAPTGSRDKPSLRLAVGTPTESN